MPNQDTFTLPNYDSSQDRNNIDLSDLTVNMLPIESPTGTTEDAINVSGLVIQTITPLNVGQSWNTGWIPNRQYGSASIVLFSDVP